LVLRLWWREVVVVAVAVVIVVMGLVMSVVAVVMVVVAVVMVVVGEHGRVRDRLSVDVGCRRD
jgi:hypothetical protein